MKFIFSFLIINLFIASSLFSQNNDDESYTAVLTGRADKIVKTLDIHDSEKYSRVVNALVAQYKALGEINDNHSAKSKQYRSDIKIKSELDEKLLALDNETNSKLYTQQCVFIGNLAVDLTNDQIEKVKDGMTYGVVKVTYDSYNDMIPTLKEDEKRQIYAWLIEAREHAMSASSSKDKHGWFGKYKGRINNYLSKQGYDTQAERKAWEERVKARGGRL